MKKWTFHTIGVLNEKSVRNLPDNSICYRNINTGSMNIAGLIIKHNNKRTTIFEALRGEKFQLEILNGSQENFYSHLKGIRFWD